MMIRYLLWTFLILTVTTSTWAQILDPTICSERLEDAKKSYEAGQLKDVSDKIEDCLEKRPAVFSQEKMVDGYKLLTESHLFRNNISDGTRSYEKLLTFNPLFEADSTDPSNSYDLIYLSRTYRQKPIISTYVNFGTNYTLVNILQEYATDNTVRPAQNYNQLRVGISGALGIEVPVWRDFTLVLEGNFAWRTYRYQDSLLISSGTANPIQQQLVYSNLQFNEQQIWIDVPLMLRYEHYMKRYKKIIPYVYIGGAPNFLLTANLSNIQRNTTREPDFGGQVIGGERTVTIAGSGLNAKDRLAEGGDTLRSLRTAVNASIVAGIGSKFRLGRHFLVIEARYSRFLLNTINRTNRYDNDELLFEYNYVDNDYRMDNFSLSVGFELSFYKPRKKRKYDPIVIDRRLDRFLQKEKTAAKRTTDSELKRELNSFIRTLERDKPGILEDVRRGRASSRVIEEASEEIDKIKDK